MSGVRGCRIKSGMTGMKVESRIHPEIELLNADERNLERLKRIRAA